MGMREWYVIQSKPRKETFVCAQLKSQARAIEVFFPRIRNHLGVRPLFPSYLFVRTVIEKISNYKILKYTRGVLRIIGRRNGMPIPVSHSVISTIQERLSVDGIIDQKKFLKLGQKIVVRKGPLKDLIGILEKPVADGDRVQVLFKLLKYPLRAVLKFQDLAVTEV